MSDNTDVDVMQAAGGREAEPSQVADVPDPDGGTRDLPEAAEKAPWEREGEEFDPAKAWSLIQNLRKEKTELTQKNRAYEDEKLTEQEKAQRDLKEAQDQLAKVQQDKAWAEARARYPQLKDEDFDLIGAGTPEQITDKAAKLAARIDAQAASDADSRTINPLLRAQPTGGSDPTKAGSDKDWLREAMYNK
jgi:hypothetical protein